MDHILDVKRVARAAWRLGAALAVVVAAACSEDPARIVAPHITPDTPQGTVRTMLVCTATTHQTGTGSPSVACTPVRAGSRMIGAAVTAGAARGPSADVIVGKQNVYVTLAVGNFAFNAVTNRFTFDATVKNLMAQPIGTTNGTVVAGNGVSVFFVAGPSVSQGVGPVTTVGTSTGTFTATNQAYYKYVQIIKPDSTSASQTWTFQLASTVSSFNFAVEIDAAAPAEKSVLRWTTIRQGVNANQLNAVWQDATTDVWAVGLKGTVLHYDGATWSSVTNGFTRGYPFHGVSGKSSSDLWAVADGGAALHYNGTTWTLVTTGTVANLYAVWQRASNDVYAVGAAGKVLRYNGTAWSSVAIPGNPTDTLRAVFGLDATHVYAAGDNGRTLFFDGTTWTSTTQGTQTLRGIWGTSPTSLFAVGDNGTVLQYNGAGVTTTTPVAVELDAVGGNSATDVWAVGANGTTIHYNGTTWSQSGPVVGVNLHGVTYGSASPVWAVGDGGALVSFGGSSWALSNQSGLPIKSIWASSATDVWASTLGTILHYDGTNWSSAYVSPSDTMFALWGFTSNNVHSLGSNGNVAIWNGTSWSLNNIGATGYDAEWGTNTSTLCAVGTAGEVICNSGNANAVNTTATLTGLWGTSGNTMFTTATNGAVFKTTNGGASWNAMTTPAAAESLYAVSGVTGANAGAWVVGQAGTIYTNNTANNTWTAQTSNTSTALHGVWAGTAPAGYTADVYAVGDNGTTQHYNGSFWINMPTHTTANLRAVFGTSASNVYLGGDNGVVLVGTQ